ncbi:hypothetical protein L6452_06490 [Arctium lappa]|uniref:Uncharacterized protein n=1 Tax=Arctium lappa TaxID=4217 RepID=A0ACB9EJ95_ARCLA|nr:hypothetical protein L6452_06490 [Arctium lappa]
MNNLECCLKSNSQRWFLDQLLKTVCFYFCFLIRCLWICLVATGHLEQDPGAVDSLVCFSSYSVHFSLLQPTICKFFYQVAMAVVVACRDARLVVDATYGCFE